MSVGNFSTQEKILFDTWWPIQAKNHLSVMYAKKGFQSKRTWKDTTEFTQERNHLSANSVAPVSGNTMD